MYSTFLIIHSLLRWVVIITALWAVAKSFSGKSGNKPFTKKDGLPGLLFMISMDTQLLVGIILWFFLSPITKPANISMTDPVSRFYGVEHAIMMTAAIAFAHIGRAMTKKGEDASKYRKSAIWFTASFIIMLAAIPWPFRNDIGRALWPF